jgi:hypothetical protein
MQILFVLFNMGHFLDVLVWGSRNTTAQLFHTSTGKSVLS